MSTLLPLLFTVCMAATCIPELSQKGVSQQSNHAEQLAPNRAAEGGVKMLMPVLNLLLGNLETGAFPSLLRSTYRQRKVACTCLCRRPWKSFFLLT